LPLSSLLKRKNKKWSLGAALLSDARWCQGTDIAAIIISRWLITSTIHRCTTKTFSAGG
ncbi:hypothetical protein BAE44_0024427, partial [Dichanthelium oligosanthes]